MMFLFNKFSKNLMCQWLFYYFSMLIIKFRYKLKSKIFFKLLKKHSYEFEIQVKQLIFYSLKTIHILTKALLA